MSIRIICLCLVVLFSCLSIDGQDTRLPKNIYSKIGIIDKTVFYDKDSGIVELVNELNTIETSLKGRKDRLEQLQSQIQLRVKDLRAHAPIDRRETKVLENELTSLNNEVRKEFDGYNKDINRMLLEQIVPIDKKILDVLSRFANEEGYDAIVDVLAIDELNKTHGFICWLPMPDVTKQFIDYYNNQSRDQHK